MLSFHVQFVQTDRQTDRLTTVKQYAPDLSIRGHINTQESIYKVSCRLYKTNSCPFQNEDNIINPFSDFLCHNIVTGGL